MDKERTQLTIIISLIVVLVATVLGIAIYAGVRSNSTDGKASSPKAAAQGTPTPTLEPTPTSHIQYIDAEIEFVDRNGVPVRFKSTFIEGQKVIDIIKGIEGREPDKLKLTYMDMLFGTLLTGINGVKLEGAERWVLKVNGTEIPESIDQYSPRKGELVSISAGFKKL